MSSLGTWTHCTVPKSLPGLAHTVSLIVSLGTRFWSLTSLSSQRDKPDTSVCPLRDAITSHLTHTPDPNLHVYISTIPKTVIGSLPGTKGPTETKTRHWFFLPGAFSLLRMRGIHQMGVSINVARPLVPGAGNKQVQ